jgi:hypothetical protein
MDSEIVEFYEDTTTEYVCVCEGGTETVLADATGNYKHCMDKANCLSIDEFEDETGLASGTKVLFHMVEGAFTSDLPITPPADGLILMGVPGTRAIIDGQDTASLCIDIDSIDNITFKDLIVINATNTNIHIEDATGIEIDNCIITGSGDQGLQLIQSASVEIYNTRLSDNADEGISIHSGTAKTYDCLIAANATGVNALSGTTYEAYDTDFINNSVYDFNGYGADFYRCFFKVYGTAESVMSNGNTVLAQSCVWDASELTYISKRLFTIPGTGTLNNCTIAGSGNYGRAVCVKSTGTVTANNTIFYDLWNIAYVYAGGSFTTNYSCIYDYTSLGSGTHNNTISTDPDIEDVSGGDYSLGANSSCIDSGKFDVGDPYDAIVKDFFETVITTSTGAATGNKVVGAIYSE